jgi:hypothetical protein
MGLLAATVLDWLPTVEQDARTTAGRSIRKPRATTLVSPSLVGCKTIPIALFDNL